MRVFGDRILVALPPEPDEIVSPSGLVLTRDPDVIRTAVQGIVMQVGERRGVVDLDDVLDCFQPMMPTRDIRADIAKLKPPPFDVQVGDCVVFSRFVGEEIQEGAITYVVLRETDIIGVREPTNEAAA